MLRVRLKMSSHAENAQKMLTHAEPDLKKCVFAGSASTKVTFENVEKYLRM
jgi:hypothetical protein